MFNEKGWKHFVLKFWSIFTLISSSRGRSCTLKVNSGAQQVWPDLCTGIWLDLTCGLEGRGSLAAWMRVENATPIWVVAAHAQQFRTSHPTACHVENLGCCSTCPSVRCFWLASSELGVIELVPESNPATLRRVNGPHALLVGQGRCACVPPLLPNLTIALLRLKPSLPFTFLDDILHTLLITSFRVSLTRLPFLLLWSLYWYLAKGTIYLKLLSDVIFSTLPLHPLYHVRIFFSPLLRSETTSVYIRSANK